ncbi:MAG: AbrB/MazE/SpoVT family DNA-binding domain-containing protein [Bryobacteraceae bacterium]|nr:AbrB/MazE/SpoVT family DNA-binding domain-containing protein [Bryobacteraceae bacterium]
MPTIAPIDKAGRVVIPKAVRDALEIMPGDKLKLTVEGEEIRLRVQEQPSKLVRKGGLLVIPATGAALDAGTIRRTVERTRDLLARRSAV